MFRDSIGATLNLCSTTPAPVCTTGSFSADHVVTPTRPVDMFSTEILRSTCRRTTNDTRPPFSSLCDPRIDSSTAPDPGPHGVHSTVGALLTIGQSPTLHLLLLPRNFLAVLVAGSTSMRIRMVVAKCATTAGAMHLCLDLPLQQLWFAHPLATRAFSHLPKVGGFRG